MGQWRFSLHDFIFANFFTIGLAISLFFFFIVILRYGVPRPISSHFKSQAGGGGGGGGPSRLSKPTWKPSIKKVPSNDAILKSMVDITTKQLYDKIEFSDVDGGPLKQGWRVKTEEYDQNSEKMRSGYWRNRYSADKKRKKREGGTWVVGKKRKEKRNEEVIRGWWKKKKGKKKEKNNNN